MKLEEFKLEAQAPELKVDTLFYQPTERIQAENMIERLENRTIETDFLKNYKNRGTK